MNELLRANPDYNWNTESTYQGIVRKALLILEDLRGGPDGELFKDFRFFNLNYSHRHNVEIIEEALSVTGKKEKILFKTTDVAILAYRHLKIIRPDCVFFMRDGVIRRMDKCTSRALREGNDLFRLYIANEFFEQQ